MNDHQESPMELQPPVPEAEAAERGTETGAGHPDAGEARLRELGVPEDKLARYKHAPTEAPPRPSWAELMRDPEYNREMRSVVSARLKEAKAAQETLTTLSPALALLARKHGLDAEHPDPAALAQAIEAENRPRDPIHAHLDTLRQQGEAMREAFPDFDLERELQNPVFLRLTAPGMNVSVEDAYYAVHRRELQRAAAEETARRITESIRAGQTRPVENGGSAQAPALTRFDYAHATAQQRAELRRRVYEAAARGEKLYPGT